MYEGLSGFIICNDERMTVSPSDLEEEEEETEEQEGGRRRNRRRRRGKGGGIGGFYREPWPLPTFQVFIKMSLCS